MLETVGIVRALRAATTPETEFMSKACAATHNAIRYDDLSFTYRTETCKRGQDCKSCCRWVAVATTANTQHTHQRQLRCTSTTSPTVAQEALQQQSQHPTHTQHMLNDAWLRQPDWPQNPTDAYIGTQRPTEACKCPQMQTGAYRCPHKPTDAYRGLQGPTETHICQQVGICWLLWALVGLRRPLLAAVGLCWLPWAISGAVCAYAGICGYSWGSAGFCGTLTATHKATGVM